MSEPNELTPPDKPTPNSTSEYQHLTAVQDMLSAFPSLTARLDTYQDGRTMRLAEVQQLLFYLGGIWGCDRRVRFSIEFLPR